MSESYEIERDWKRIAEKRHELILSLNKRLVEETARADAAETQLKNITFNAKPVYATGINTGAVNLGYELGGYVKHYTVSTHIITGAKKAPEQKP